MIRHADPTALTEAPWALLVVRIPAAKPGGRPRGAAPREVVSAILSVRRNGITGRAPPRDRPPGATVYRSGSRRRQAGPWARLRDARRDPVRVAAGRDPRPSAAIRDSRSVQTTGTGGARGADAGQRVPGRQRHLVVATRGLGPAAAGHAAHGRDRAGARRVLATRGDRVPRLGLGGAVGGSAGKLLAWALAPVGAVIDLVAQPAGRRGSAVRPKRWIVERTVAWPGRARRPSQDDEAPAATSEAGIRVALIRLMLTRLAPGTGASQSGAQDWTLGVSLHRISEY